MSPVQVEKLTDLLLWLELSRLDLNAVIEAQGLDSNSDANKKLWDDWFKMRRTKLTEQLGDQYERFREYEHLTSSTIRAPCRVD